MIDLGDFGWLIYSLTHLAFMALIWKAKTGHHHYAILLLVCRSHWIELNWIELNWILAVYASWYEDIMELAKASGRDPAEIENELASIVGGLQG